MYYSGLEQSCGILGKVGQQSLSLYMAQSSYIQYETKETILNIGTYLSHNNAEYY